MTTAFHYRSWEGKRKKFIGGKTDMRECNHCQKTKSAENFRSKGTKNTAGYLYLSKICNICANVKRNEQRFLRASIPPPTSNHCNCCHTFTKKLCKDHIRKTKIFRGYLCNWCNVGIGHMGDNLAGVLQAAVYLENDENKIIDTLHKVFNEMFARTK